MQNNVKYLVFNIGATNETQTSGANFEITKVTTWSTKNINRKKVENLLEYYYKRYKNSVNVKNILLLTQNKINKK